MLKISSIKLPTLDFPNPGFKKYFYLVTILLLVLGLFSSIALVKRSQDLKKKAAEKILAVVNPIKTYGFIIELKNAPIVKYQQSLRLQKKSLSEINNETKVYRQTIANEHQESKEAIKKALNLKDEDWNNNLGTREYSEVFNGFALKIDETSANKIKSTVPNITAIYPDYEVKASLFDSVPLIRADQVWQLTDNQSRKVTGQGVKMAVIDTGVDYTHLDLGQTVINERQFTQVISNPLWPRLLSIDNGKLAYHLDHLIYIHDFASGQKITIPQYSSIPLWVRKAVLVDNLLAYYAMDADYNAALYFYDLTSGVHRKIIDTQGVGEIAISGGYIFYGRLKEPRIDSPGPYFFKYDPKTGIETPLNAPIFTTSFESIMSKVWGNQIASTYYDYSKKENCPEKIVLYNIDTGNTQDLVPPETGFVLDFRDNKILYAACDKNKSLQDWNVYYVYDLRDNSSLRLSYGNSNLTNSIATSERFRDLSYNTPDQIVSPQATFYTEFEYGAWGYIGQDVIYFTNNYLRTKIIAYNRNLQTNNLINLLRLPDLIKAQGNKVCFTGEYAIYCHDYNSSFSYPLPVSVFNDKVIGGYNFIDNDNNPFDDHGHGTHVSATVAGNGTLKGVAPGAKLIAYKVLNRYGTGYTSNVIAAVERAVQTRLDSDLTNDVDIISLSLGASCYNGYNVNCGPDDPTSRALDNAVDAGIVAVVAAGNNGPGLSTIDSPGTSRKAITVGAVDKSKKMADFSSRGPVVYNGETIQKPDVVAPGVSICAAEWDSWQTSSRCRDEQHITLSGTSMATPHVAGVVALIKQMYPAAPPSEIKQAIKSNSVNLGFSINDQGSGFVDSLYAIQSLARPVIKNISTLLANSGDRVNITGENFLPYNSDVTSLKVYLVHSDGGVAILASVSPYQGNVSWENNNIGFTIGQQPPQSGIITINVNNKVARYDQIFYLNSTPTPTPTLIPTPTPTNTPKPTHTPDIYPPTLKITNPINNSAVKRGSIVPITAEAYDSGVGVSSVKILVNNVLLCTLPASSSNTYLCYWTVSKVKGSNTITVNASDKVGNSSSASITVTAK